MAGLRLILKMSLLGALLLKGTVGCDPDHSDHDHSNHDHSDHDHSEGEHSEHDHDHEATGGHHHEAPHGGALIALGDHFAHVEIVLDLDTGEMRAYALDGGAESGVRIAQSEIKIEVKTADGSFEVVLAPQTSALTGEVVGDTSEFMGVEPRLKGLAAFEGVLKLVEIKGERLTDISFRYPEGNE